MGDPRQEPEPESVIREPGQVLFTELRGIYLVSDTGGTPVDVTNTRDFYFRYAEWSPNGDRIAYMARSTDRSDDYALYIMAADGSDPLKLSDVVQVVRPVFTWSPDGQRIAFGAGSDIFAVDVDGSDQLELTVGEIRGVNPHWSPDGEWIVYQGEADPAADVSGIARVRPDGSDPELLVELPWTFDRWPRYSPTSDRIAFSYDQDLHLVDTEGGAPERITFSPGEGDWWPRWSPDGTTIAFITDGGAHWTIGFLDVATSTFLGSVGSMNVDALYPDWSPDGQRVAFQLGFLSAVLAEAKDGAEWTKVGRGAHVDWRPGSGS
ncbi:MAG TPA: hypothetical protein VMN39_12850 [Longimicrobiaceae bacterium]|nr:hypothetical protein [Longimicrobiaceae bacterium]